MAARQLDRLVAAATRSPRANRVARNAGLGDEVSEGGIHVGRKLLDEQLGGFFGRKLLQRCAGAFAKSAEVDGQDVEPRCREASGEVVPNLALPVALVKQQDSRTGLGGSEIRRLEGDRSEEHTSELQSLRHL